MHAYQCITPCVLPPCFSSPLWRILLWTNEQMLLIIDTDVLFLQMAERALDVRSGVLLARDAEQALSLLRGLTATFSVVLVNSELLTHDGLPLVEQIRREHRTLPVVVISASMRQKVLEAAAALAAVRRPITPQLDAAFARLRAKAANGS